MPMSRNIITKNDIKSYVLKLQHDTIFENLTEDQTDLINKYLRDILFKLEEYTY